MAKKLEHFATQILHRRLCLEGVRQAGERSERTAASTTGFGDLSTGIFNVGMMYVVCDTEYTPLAKAVFVALTLLHDQRC